MKKIDKSGRVLCGGWNSPRGWKCTGPGKTISCNVSHVCLDVLFTLCYLGFLNNGWARSRGVEFLF
jgi:hypothetical protein